MFKSKKIMIALLVVGLLALGLITAVGADPASFAGDGAWEQVDPAPDNSNGTMWIQNMNRKSAIIAFDDGASVCGTDGYGVPLYSAFLVGSGTLNQDGGLDAHILIWCMREAVGLELELDSVFTYDVVTDTVTNFDGCWERVGSDVCPAP